MTEPSPTALVAGRSPAERLRALLRGAALALGFGLLAVFVFSLLADPLLTPAQAWLGALEVPGPARAALGLGMLALAQALGAFLVLLLGGLAGDWPLSLGARAGAVAALLPSLVLLAGQGVTVFLPWSLLAARAAGVLLVALAGVAGLTAGRRLSRGRAR